MSHEFPSPEDLTEDPVPHEACSKAFEDQLDVVKPWDRPPGEAEQKHMQVAPPTEVAQPVDLPPANVEDPGSFGKPVPATDPPPVPAGAVNPHSDLPAAGLSPVPIYGERVSRPLFSEQENAEQQENIAGPPRKPDVVGALPQSALFSRAFAAARRQRGMSQTQAAAECGFHSQGVVSQIERERMNWLKIARDRAKKYVEFQAQLNNVAAFLGCSPSELLNGKLQ